MILFSVIVNLSTAILSFFITRLYVLKNYNLPKFIDYFNIYTLAGFYTLLFYLKHYTNHLFYYIIITFVIFMYFLRSNESTTKKYHERFRTMILSFGYTRTTYFEYFLSKKLFIKGFESFSFSTAMFLLFEEIVYENLSAFSPVLVVMISALFFTASMIKSFKTGKIYKIVK